MGVEGMKPSREVVVWAIDPFEASTRPSNEMVARLAKWVRMADVDVQPVYVLALPNDDTEFDMIEENVNSYADSARRAAKQYLRDLGIHDAVLQPKIVISGKSSRLHEVKRLLEYIDAVNAPWVIVSSHGRTGINRLFFGSFAENLVHHSTRPVLFLTHLSKEAPEKLGQRTVLFPTDFSEGSVLAFNDFLKSARRLGCELVLYHTVIMPPVASPGWAPQALPGSYFFEQEKWARHEAAEMLRAARARRIEARLVIRDETYATQVGESILDCARKENAQMIVMSSKSGALESLVVGSTARDVFRANRYPVWVYGPKAFENDTYIEEYRPAPAV